MAELPYVVVIVDDHELFSHGLALLLDRHGSSFFTIAGHATFVEVDHLVERAAADVAVVGVDMPPHRGVSAIRQIKRTHPSTRILALSGTGDTGLAMEALRAGADGFIPKTARPEALAGPLMAVAEGLRVVEGSVLDNVMDRSCPPVNTVRETLGDHELLLWTLVATGMETSELARRMTVSERTVKRMVAALLRKLGVPNRIAAAALAGQHGLTGNPPQNSDNA